MTSALDHLPGSRLQEDGEDGLQTATRKWEREPSCYNSPMNSDPLSVWQRAFGPIRREPFTIQKGFWAAREAPNTRPCRPASRILASTRVTGRLLNGNHGAPSSLSTFHVASCHLDLPLWPAYHACQRAGGSFLCLARSSATSAFSRGLGFTGFRSTIGRDYRFV